MLDQRRCKRRYDKRWRRGLDKRCQKVVNLGLSEESDMTEGMNARSEKMQKAI